MGSAAAARRTESSFPVFLASTNPSDLIAEYASASYGGLPAFANTVKHLHDVRRAETAVEPIADLLQRDGAPTDASISTGFRVVTVASVDGLFFNQDRVTVIQGRMANPRRPDQVVLSAEAAHLLRLRVGAVVPMGFYTNAQAESGDFGTPRVRPVVRIEARIVGLVEFNNQVVEDDIDRQQGYVLLDPALTRLLLKAGTSSGISWYGLQLDHGPRDVAAVEHEINGQLRENTTLGQGEQAQFDPASRNEEQARSAIEPDWIALAAFAVIAIIAALLIAAQAVARQLRAIVQDQQVLRALGAGPGMTAADGLIGTLAAVVVGSLLAAGVAVVLSPVAPIGPVRPVYPSPGIAFDWTVLGFGFLALAGGLSTIAVILARRSAPHYATGPSTRISTPGSAAGRLAAASGLPAPAVMGIRFAFDPGRGRGTVPVRSALSGTVVAVVLTLATLTFGSSLAHLVSHPALYGWDWTYAVSSDDGYGAIPQQQLGSRLRGNPDVAAWTTVSFLTADLDEQAVPVLLGRPHAAIGPPVLSGHPVDGKYQIVLGPATLAQLHKHLGDTVNIRFGNFISTQLTIVGTATMPVVGIAQGLHTSLGTGAVASDQLLGAVAGNCDGPPGMAFVRMRAVVSGASGATSMQRIAKGITKELASAPASNPCSGDSLTVLGVQHPAQIANWRAMDTAPESLAAGLAASAMAALGLSLFASVRRRRRDLAVLKTIGFTRRQLAATVAWHASVAAITGIVVGVPLGIALGRSLWDLFARQIYVVPEPTVPAEAITLVAIGTLLLANLAAAVPGNSAARTPTALALRAE